MKLLIPQREANVTRVRDLKSLFRPVTQQVEVVSGLHEIPREVRDAQLLVVDHTMKVTADVMARLPELMGVVTASTGFDHVDLAAARERRIAVCNVPDYATESVAWMTMSLVRALSGQLFGRFVRTNGGQAFPEWTKNGRLGSSWGVVGYGNIGRRVAELAWEMTGMPVRVFARTPLEDTERVHFMNLEKVLEGSDVVSLHVPGDKSTRGMIGQSEFFTMRDSGFLVNTARGAVVDECALLEALAYGRIVGAALDVFAREPLPPNSPLLGHPKIFATPHRGASFLPEAQESLWQKVLEVVRSFAEGRPIHRVV